MVDICHYTFVKIHVIRHQIWTLNYGLWMMTMCHVGWPIATNRGGGSEMYFQLNICCEPKTAAYYVVHLKLIYCMQLQFNFFLEI